MMPTTERNEIVKTRFFAMTYLRDNPFHPPYAD